MCTNQMFTFVKNYRSNYKCDERAMIDLVRRELKILLKKIIFR